MNLSLKFIRFCFCLISLSFLMEMELNAQSKKADLHLIVNGAKNERYSYSIYQNDTLKSITKIATGSSFTKDHILRCGTFRIEIYKNDSIYHEFTDILLECGYKTSYVINLEAKTSYQTMENAVPDKFSYVNPYSPVYRYFYSAMNLEYGTRVIEETPIAVQHSFRFGGGGFMNFPITRHLGFGYHPESTIQLMFPHRGADFRSGQNYRHERYFCWDLKAGFYLRISTFNMKAAHDKGIFLDLGGNYHFPIFFRHIGLYDNHKDVTRQIHKYNDVSLIARIGSDAFSIYAQYRLFDYLKTPFPQAPILSFGLNIRVED